MALTPEDGTGLALADCYDSLANFKTWATSRGRDYSAYSDATIEAALREGFQWINNQKFRGYIAANSVQIGAFPRESLTARHDGRVVTGVPQRVVWANFELAWARLTSGSDLYQDQERGGRIASESVGPISVSYFADAPSQKVFAAAAALLSPYLKEGQEAYAPYIGGAAGQASTVDAPTELTPLFSVGMHENSDG